MSLIPWKPFTNLDQFFDDEEWFLPVFPRLENTKPAMDLYETEKEIVAEVNLPGFDPEKLEVSVENGMLKVSGKIDEEKENKDKGYWRKEIRRSSFERIISLPVPIKENEISAVYEKGILKITMPKAKAEPKSKVQIKVKEK